MSVSVLRTSAPSPSSTASRGSTTSLLTKALAVGSAAALTVLAVAMPAAAHVTANPETAEQGSFTKVSFRVPNEQDKATTKVEIELPLDHPIAVVSVRPVPGWTSAVVRSKLPKPIKSDDRTITEAVSKITWSKGKINPGEFQEFDVSMGPLPTDTDTLAFKAIQTYAGGEVVRWDQPTPPGGEEPEHPAPALHLTKPGGSGGHGAAADANGAAGAEGVAARPAAQQGASAGATADSDDGMARLLAGLGLATGVIGIIVATLALTRRRPSA
ncbi:MAG TPA: YcnI family protein [Streptosporangiaceae bacterium]|nr:YcnI family protein [Streptosporangiaceae bacterium]